MDATYSVDRHPSGIAVYSRQLMDGLASAHPSDRFLHCYRWKQWRAVTKPPRANQAPQANQVPQANVERRLLLPPLPTFHADLFHALNQRVDRRPAPRVVATFHDLFVLTAEYSSPGFRARFEKQARQAALNADLVLAVSDFTAHQVETLLRVPKQRIRVVPHGVSPPPHPPLPVESRQQVILFVGALQRRKNVSRLVQAFAALPDSWRLVLAGAPTGFAANEVLDAIASSPARDRIEVTGYVPHHDLLMLYQTSAIFAFPSLDEGFGMPILEAMAHGLPVVTSARSAMPEVAGDSAILVDPEQGEELAEALRRLVLDVDLRDKLSRLGRERAQMFSWDRTCELTYNAYQELL